VTAKPSPASGSTLTWLLNGWGRYVLGVVLILAAASSSAWRGPALLLLGALLIYELEAPKP
jgi:hypothetical protein